MEVCKMKKTLLVLLTILLVFSLASVAVFAEDESVTSEATSEVTSETTSEESSESDNALNLEFYPDGFTRNIQYMGLGMLGIFVVVGVVILLTLVLNKVTTKKE
jgi:hypothetical protein